MFRIEDKNDRQGTSKTSSSNCLFLLVVRFLNACLCVWCLRENVWGVIFPTGFESGVFTFKYDISAKLPPFFKKVIKFKLKKNNWIFG